MRVVVRHTVGALAEQLANDARGLRGAVGRTTRKHAREGAKLSKKFAREKSGPHGLHYWKRISAEATGPNTAEWGPTGIPKSNFVGAGYRTAGGNTDLDRAADVIVPKWVRAIDADVRRHT